MRKCPTSLRVRATQTHSTTGCPLIPAKFAIITTQMAHTGENVVKRETWPTENGNWKNSAMFVPRH